MNEVSFNLNVAENKKRFASLFSVINRSVVLPILHHVHIVNNGVLSLTATDLENAVRIECKQTNKKEFSFCIDGKKLQAFFKNNVEDEVRFKGDLEKLNIDNGGFKLTTRLEKSDNFPKEYKSDNLLSIKINSQELAPLFENALKFASNDDLRPAMTGILLKDCEGELNVVSTDAHKLFHAAALKTPTAFKGISKIIPTKGVRMFLSLFKNEEVEIGFDDRYMVVQGEGKRLTSRLIDARYPDYEVVLVKHQLTFSVIRSQLLSFAKIAFPFVNPITRQVIIEVSKDSISLSGGDKDEDNDINFKLPIYNPTVPIENTFKFGVNLKFLQTALSVNAKDEYVLIEHSTIPTKGFNVDGKILMMPLMLNDSYLS